MAHAFTLWFDRFFTGAHSAAYTSPGNEPPLKVEVERLPDYLWRELGFPQPTRPDAVPGGWVNWFTPSAPPTD